MPLSVNGQPMRQQTPEEQHLDDFLAKTREEALRLYDQLIPALRERASQLEPIATTDEQAAYLLSNMVDGVAFLLVTANWLDDQYVNEDATLSAAVDDLIGTAE